MEDFGYVLGDKPKKKQSTLRRIKDFFIQDWLFFLHAGVIILVYIFKSSFVEPEGIELEMITLTVFFCLASFLLLIMPYEYEHKCIVDVCRRFNFHPSKVFKAYKLKFLALTIYINLAMSLFTWIQLLNYTTNV